MKYCDASQHINMTKLHRYQETLHPISVPLKVWSQIGINLLGPSQEIDGYKYIVTSVDYTDK